MGVFSISGDKRQIISNFASLAILRGFDYLIPLITLPYLIRTIGVDLYGQLAFCLSLALYFGAFMQYGFSVTAVREIARNRNDSVKLTAIYSQTLTASLILSLICLAAFISITIFTEKFGSLFYICLSSFIFIALQSLFPIWFFQGMEKMKYIAYINLSCRALLLVLLILLVRTPKDYALVPMLSAITTGMSFLAALLVINIKFKIHYKLPRARDIKSVLIDGRHAFVSQLAPNLYNNSSTFLLGYYTNNTTVGIFSSATKLIDIFCSVSYLISNAFLPYLSRNLKSHKPFRKMMLTLGFGLTAIAFIFSDLIVNILFSSANPEISDYVKWISISILCLFSIQTYSTCYLMLIHREAAVKNIALYTSLAFFIFAIMGIPQWGIKAAAITLVGARLSMALITYIYFKKFNTPAREQWIS